MAEIKDIYNTLSGNNKYKGSLEDFETKWNDEAYKSKVFRVLSRNNLTEETNYEDFVSNIGSKKKDVSQVSGTDVSELESETPSILSETTVDASSDVVKNPTIDMSTYQLKSKDDLTDPTNNDRVRQIRSLDGVEISRDNTLFPDYKKGDAKESSVILASGELTDDGGNPIYIAYPTLFPKDKNKYTSHPDDWFEAGDNAYDIAKERGEIFKFDNKQDAELFARGSWKFNEQNFKKALKYYNRNWAPEKSFQEAYNFIKQYHVDVANEKKKKERENLERLFPSKYDNKVFRTGINKVETSTPWDWSATNSYSSAVGAYQFLYNTHKKTLKELFGVNSKEEFIGNQKAQEGLMTYMLEDGKSGRYPALARSLYKLYPDQLDDLMDNDFGYNEDGEWGEIDNAYKLTFRDFLALEHFAGHGELKKILKRLKDDDNFNLKEFFEYIPGRGVANKSIAGYLNQAFGAESLIWKDPRGFTDADLIRAQKYIDRNWAIPTEKNPDPAFNKKAYDYLIEKNKKKEKYGGTGYYNPLDGDNLMANIKNEGIILDDEPIYNNSINTYLNITGESGDVDNAFYFKDLDVEQKKLIYNNALAYMENETALNSYAKEQGYEDIGDWYAKANENEEDDINPPNIQDIVQEIKNKKKEQAEQEKIRLLQSRETSIISKNLKGLSEDVSNTLNNLIEIDPPEGFYRKRNRKIIDIDGNEITKTTELKPDNIYYEYYLNNDGEEIALPINISSQTSIEDKENIIGNIFAPIPVDEMLIGEGNYFEDNTDYIEFIKSKQLELVNNGYNIGTTANGNGIDGDWGKTSQRKWWEYVSSSKFKPNKENVVVKDLFGRKITSINDIVDGRVYSVIYDDVNGVTRIEDIQFKSSHWPNYNKKLLLKGEYVPIVDKTIDINNEKRDNEIKNGGLVSGPFELLKDSEEDIPSAVENIMNEIHVSDNLSKWYGTVFNRKTIDDLLKTSGLEGAVAARNSAFNQLDVLSTYHAYEQGIVKDLKHSEIIGKMGPIHIPYTPVSIETDFIKPLYEATSDDLKKGFISDFTTYIENREDPYFRHVLGPYSHAILSDENNNYISYDLHEIEDGRYILKTQPKMVGPDKPEEWFQTPYDVKTFYKQLEELNVLSSSRLRTFKKLREKQINYNKTLLKKYRLSESEIKRLRRYEDYIIDYWKDESTIKPTYFDGRWERNLLDLYYMTGFDYENPVLFPFSDIITQEAETAGGQMIQRIHYDDGKWHYLRDLRYKNIETGEEGDLGDYLESLGLGSTKWDYYNPGGAAHQIYQRYFQDIYNNKSDLDYSVYGVTAAQDVFDPEDEALYRGKTGFEIFSPQMYEGKDGGIGYHHPLGTWDDTDMTTALNNLKYYDKLMTIHQQNFDVLKTYQESALTYFENSTYEIVPENVGGMIADGYKATGAELVTRIEEIDNRLNILQPKLDDIKDILTKIESGEEEIQDTLMQQSDAVYNELTGAYAADLMAKARDGYFKTEAEYQDYKTKSWNKLQDDLNNSFAEILKNNSDILDKNLLLRDKFSKYLNYVDEYNILVSESNAIHNTGISDDYNAIYEIELRIQDEIDDHKIIMEAYTHLSDRVYEGMEKYNRSIHKKWADWIGDNWASRGIADLQLMISKQGGNIISFVQSQLDSELYMSDWQKTMISERPDISNDLDIMIQRIKHRDINKVSKAPKGRDLTTLIDYLDIYDDVTGKKYKLIVNGEKKDIATGDILDYSDNGNVITDTELRRRLLDKYEENKDEYSDDIQRNTYAGHGNLFANTSEMGGDMFFLIYGGWRGRGLGIKMGMKPWVAATLGFAATNTVLQYDDLYFEALTAMEGTEWEGNQQAAGGIAFGISTFIGSLEQINPNFHLTGQLRRELLENVTYKFAKSKGKKALRLIIAEELKFLTKQVFWENIQEASQTLAENGLKLIANKQMDVNFHTETSNKEWIDIFAHTTLLTGGVTTTSQAYRQLKYGGSPLMRDALFNIASRENGVERAKTALDKQYEEEKITEEEYNSAMKSLNALDIILAANPGILEDKETTDIAKAATIQFLLEKEKLESAISEEQNEEKKAELQKNLDLVNLQLERIETGEFFDGKVISDKILQNLSNKYTDKQINSLNDVIKKANEKGKESLTIEEQALLENFEIDFKEMQLEVDNTYESDAMHIFASEGNYNPTKSEIYQMVQSLIVSDNAIMKKQDLIRNEQNKSNEEINEAIKDGKEFKTGNDEINVNNISLLDDLIEQVHTTVQKRIIQQTKNILSKHPNLNIILHHDEKSFYEANKHIENVVERTRGVYRDGNQIHINMKHASSNTLLHESIEHIISEMKINNNELYTSIIDNLYDHISSSNELSPYVKFGEEYEGDETKKKESVVEFLADVSNGDIALPSNKKLSLFKRLRGWLSNRLIDLGVTERDVSSLTFNEILGITRGILEGKKVSGPQTQEVNTINSNAQQIAVPEAYNNAMNNYMRSDLGGGKEGLENEKNDFIEQAQTPEGKKYVENVVSSLMEQYGNNDGTLTVYRVGNMNEGYTPVSLSSELDFFISEREKQGLNTQYIKVNINPEDISAVVLGIENELLVNVNENNIGRINKNTKVLKQQEDISKLQNKLNKEQRELEKLDSAIKDGTLESRFPESYKYFSGRGRDNKIIKIDNLKKQINRLKAPKTDAPKIDAPKIDTPKMDTPKMDTAKMDVSLQKEVDISGLENLPSVDIKFGKTAAPQNVGKTYKLYKDDSKMGRIFEIEDGVPIRELKGPEKAKIYTSIQKSPKGVEFFDSLELEKAKKKFKEEQAIKEKEVKKKAPKTSLEVNLSIFNEAKETTKKYEKLNTQTNIKKIEEISGEVISDDLKNLYRDTYRKLKEKINEFVEKGGDNLSVKYYDELQKLKQELDVYTNILETKLQADNYHNEFKKEEVKAAKEVKPVKPVKKEPKTIADVVKKTPKKSEIPPKKKKKYTDEYKKKIDELRKRFNDFLQENKSELGQNIIANTKTLRMINDIKDIHSLNAAIKRINDIITKQKIKKEEDTNDKLRKDIEKESKITKGKGNEIKKKFKHGGSVLVKLQKIYNHVFKARNKDNGSQYQIDMLNEMEEIAEKIFDIETNLDKYSGKNRQALEKELEKLYSELEILEYSQLNNLDTKRLDELKDNVMNLVNQGTTKSEEQRKKRFEHYEELRDLARKNRKRTKGLFGLIKKGVDKSKAALGRQFKKRRNAIDIPGDKSFFSIMRTLDIYDPNSFFVNYIYNKKRKATSNSRRDKYEFERKWTDSLKKILGIKDIVINKSQKRIRLGSMQFMRIGEIKIPLGSLDVALSGIQSKFNTGITVTNNKGETLDLFMSQSQLLDVWMMSKDPSNTASLESMGFTQEVLEEIDNLLDDKIKNIGNFLFEQYQEFYNKYNETYKKLYGIDMPKISEFYTPRRVKESHDIDDLHESISNFNSNVFNSHTLKRQEHSNEIEIEDVFNKFWSYFNMMERWHHHSDLLKDMSAVFGDGKVRGIIKENFGSGYLTIIDHYIKEFKGENNNAAIRMPWLSEITGMTSKIILALNRGVGLKQTLSHLMYISEMPLWYTLRGYLTMGMYKPNVDIKDSPFVKYRGQRTHLSYSLIGPDNNIYSRSGFLKQAMKGIESMYAKNPTTRKASKLMPLEVWNKVATWVSLLTKGSGEIFTVFSRVGDHIGITLLGQEYINYRYDVYRKKGFSHAEAVEKAILDFEVRASNTQQTEASDETSFWRAKAGSIGQLFTQFTTSPAQIREDVMLSLQEAEAGKNVKQNTARVLIGGGVLTSVFAFISNSLRWDDEEQLLYLYKVPIQGMFPIGQIADLFIGYEKYGVKSTAPFIQRTLKSMEKSKKVSEQEELIQEFYRKLKRAKADGDKNEFGEYIIDGKVWTEEDIAFYLTKENNKLLRLQREYSDSWQDLLIPKKNVKRIYDDYMAFVHNLEKAEYLENIITFGEYDTPFFKKGDLEMSTIDKIRRVLGIHNSYSTGIDILSGKEDKEFTKLDAELARHLDEFWELYQEFKKFRKKLTPEELTPKNVNTTDGNPGIYQDGYKYKMDEFGEYTIMDGNNIYYNSEYVTAQMNDYNRRFLYFDRKARSLIKGIQQHDNGVDIKDIDIESYIKEDIFGGSITDEDFKKLLEKLLKDY